ILLIVILLAAATAPALGYLHRRRRSRVPAVASDELPGNSNSSGAAASEPAPAVQAAAEDPPAQVPVPTATSSDGLRRGALDLGLDTSTPEGRRVAGALITLNGWASEWLADGTHRSATNGRPKNRERGRAPLHQRADVLQRIGEMDESGMSAQQIADQLNE